MECANGDIVIVGNYRDYIAKFRNAAIIRYNKNGKLLWQKMYEDEGLTEKYSSFFSVKEADNGDIVVTGEYYNKNGTWNDEIYTWFVRLDSLGCQEPGCGVLDTLQLIQLKSDYIHITATDEVLYDNSKSGEVAIYPNPTKDVINISVPEGFEAEDIEVFDVLGNQFMKIQSDLKEFDVKYLKSGLYIIIVSDKSGRFVTGKFVKR